MVVFPNCKINLGLNIIRKRNDGFHDIETVFYPLPIYDVLEVIPQNNREEERNFSFHISGISLDDNKENNLCVKAWHLLKKDFPAIPTVQMHLHKVIPAGAGLGGGSADAAFTLKLLNSIFRLGLPEQKLIDYALELGSDCPFFITNKPGFATGRGELLETLPVSLATYRIVVVNPGIHIQTAHVFAHITPAVPQKSIREIIDQPVTTWKDELENDFEKIVFKQYPEVKKIKDQLYEAGATYSSMSGSGSTVFGIFEKERKLNLSFPNKYFVKEITIGS